MLRRGVIATLLVIVAVQLMGGILFATVCVERCSDEGPGESCPPVCALCIGCTHAQPAMVGTTITAQTLAVASHEFAARPMAAPSPLAADIFHVPLLG